MTDPLLSLRIELPIACAMCGAQDRPLVMTKNRSTGHKATTCSPEDQKCTNTFWVAHAKDEAITPASVDWSHRTKLLATKQLLQGDVIAEKRVSGPDQKPVDDAELQLMIERFGALKAKMGILYSDFEKRKAAPVPGQDEVKQWMVSFDQFMRDLNELYSSEFTDKFLKYAHDLEILRRQKGGASAAETAAITELLRDLVKSMPLNRALYERRNLLKTVLGFDKYTEDRLVLTLDGGGMKGVVTLVVLKKIRDYLRKKTGLKSLRLDQCFDLVIGTSTGGIISGCMCARELDLEEIFALYENLGSKAFSPENVTDMFWFRGACRYADYPMMQMLFDLFGTKRLDDPELAFKESASSGPTAVRFGFIAVDMSIVPSRTLLLRNYEKVLTECCPLEKTEAWVEGTNQCYLVEAVRATASPPGIIHPYGRHYPPVENHFDTYMSRVKTRYMKIDRHKDYSNLDLILDRVDPAHRNEHEVRAVKDGLMKDAVLIDGGLAANNPEVMALLEAVRLWGHLENCGIRVFSVGTGEMPVQRNPSWNSSVKRPLEQGLRGKPNILSVYMDLLKYTYIYAATGTEEAADIMKRLGSVVAAPRRLNPQMRRVVEMDDASPEAIRELFDAAVEWCASEKGSKEVQDAAEEIFVTSSRLHELVARNQQKQ